MHRSIVQKATQILLLSTVLVWASCEKEPGLGGLATISGKVYGYDYNSLGVLHDSGYVGDVQVYISYGTDSTTDDNVRTGINGEYSFQGLQKGVYSVWTYTFCDSCNFNQIALVQQAEVTETDQVVVLPDFIIED